MFIYADSEKVSHSRSIYNSLDFLGDVGGLMEGLKMVATPFLGLLSNGGLSRWFISQIFFRNPSENKPPHVSMAQTTHT